MSGGFALHLLRHGQVLRHDQSEGTGRLLGHTDAPPCSAGIAQCVVRAQALKVETLVSSDLARAQAAAEAIANRKSLPLRIDLNWREINFGQWDGADPATLDDEALTRFYADPDAFSPPGGERWSELGARIRSGLALIDRPTLVVSHAGAIRAALAVLFGFDHRQVWAFSLPYTSILSLHIEGDFAEITGLIT